MKADMTENEKNVLNAYRAAENDVRDTLNKLNERKALHAIEARNAPNLKSVGQLIRVNEHLKAALKSLDSI